MTDIFPNLPDNARVWVYQSSREFNIEEAAEVQQAIDAFVQAWTSHSRDVIADGKLIHNRFIVLCADETQFAVSGCSIDSSVRFVKDLGGKYNIDLFDRLNLAYVDAYNKVQTLRKPAFAQLIAEGTITDNTNVFNNLVATKAELLSQWQVPLKDSWHAKIFAV